MNLINSAKVDKFSGSLFQARRADRPEFGQKVAQWAAETGGVEHNCPEISSVTVIHLAERRLDVSDAQHPRTVLGKRDAILQLHVVV